jgi:hypothetical protein
MQPCCGEQSHCDQPPAVVVFGVRGRRWQRKEAAPTGKRRVEYSTAVGTCSPVQVDPTGECSDVNRVFSRDGNSMCPQAPRLSPEYSHKAGLQTVIAGRPLQIRPAMRSGHAGPVTMGRITRGPPCWTRSQDETTSSQVFVRRRVGRRVSLPVVLSSLVQRGRRKH